MTAKIIKINEKPQLAFFTNKDIVENEELTCNYEPLRNIFFWRKGTLSSETSDTVVGDLVSKKTVPDESAISEIVQSSDEEKNYIPDTDILIHLNNEATIISDSTIQLEKIAACSAQTGNQCNVLAEQSDQIDHGKEIRKYLNSRPSRPCPFCGYFRQKLSRHLILKHSNQPIVQELKAASTSKKASIMLKLRRKGIYRNNISVMKSGSNNIEVDSKCSASLSKDPTKKYYMCTECKGFFVKKHFSNHMCTVSAPRKHISRRVPCSTLTAPNVTDEIFQSDIIDKFRNDSVGKICKSDNILYKIGINLYNASCEKPIQSKQKCMKVMRNLASIKHGIESKKGKEIEILDIFRTKTISLLTQVIDELCTQKGKVLPGAKINYFFTIKTGASHVKSQLFIGDKEIEAEEIARFEKIFSSLWKTNFKLSKDLS